MSAPPSEPAGPIRVLVRPFLDICLLRLGPQDLPTSALLLGITLGTHTVIGATLSGIHLGGRLSVLAGLADSLLLVALTSSLLLSQRLTARLLQTLTALAGCGTVISVIALPVALWSHGVRSAGGPIGAAELILLAMIGWNIAIVGHILRHALSVRLFTGVMLAVLFYWISTGVLEALFFR